VTFLHPEFLYLMLPLVLILFYFILTQKEPAAVLFESRIYARLRVNEKRLSLRQRNIIYLLAFILLIAAMAQPVIEEATVRVKAPEQELMVAIDISASMQSKDLYPSRLAVARAKLLQLIDRAESERIGILAFGKDVYVVSPPSGDKAALRQMLEHFEPDAYAEKGTDMMALLAAANSAMHEAPRKNLLLLTDGGDLRDFSGAAAYAKANKMHLYILGTATPGGGPLILDGTPVMKEGRAVETSLNPSLRALAASTGGLYLSAAIGASDITALTAELRRHAEGGSDGVREIRRYGQLFILPLGFALLLILVANASMSKRERVAVPPALLLGMLLFGGGAPLHAEPFDYELLEEAKTYYEKRDFPRAARTFYRYAKHKDNDPRALYDSAHALYRAGKYEAAAALWGSIRAKERHLQFNILHNLGNAYAMQGGEEQLQAAIKAYRKALYLQNDPRTRENLEIVRGRLMRLMQEKLRTQRGASPLSGSKQPQSKPMDRSAANRAESPAAESTDEDAGEAKPTEATGEAKTAQMSDFEAAMWMQSLQRQTRTHLYRISPESAKGGEHVDPW
jgi:Ca-activated chloride channel family protein